MNRTLASLAVLALATAPSAFAHEDHERSPKKKTAAPAPDAKAATSHGPGDHEHESPHGGLVGTIDKDTHVEVLFTDAAVQVWFYDDHMKPLPPPTDAKATVVIDKEVKKLELPIAKNADGTATDHVGALLTSAKAQKLSIVIQATLIGKARSARVERAPAATLQLAPGAK